LYRGEPVRILIPLPDVDFDPTEVAVPWHALVNAGHQVVFATEQSGTVPAADRRLLSGVIFGKLGADQEPLRFYGQLSQSDELHHTVAWSALDADSFDGLILPGGHAPGMRQYLGSPVLHERVATFWAAGRPVGAICHGVLVLARAVDGEGRSLLHDRRTTCLPKYMERSAYLATAWKLGRYYRTYPAYVEDEVKRSLASAQQLQVGPRTLAKGTDGDDRHAFVVEDGHYLSARWPGDAYLFSKRFVAKL